MEEDEEEEEDELCRLVCEECLGSCRWWWWCLSLLSFPRRTPSLAASWSALSMARSSERCRLLLLEGRDRSSKGEKEGMLREGGGGRCVCMGGTKAAKRAGVLCFVCVRAGRQGRVRGVTERGKGRKSVVGAGQGTEHVIGTDNRAGAWGGTFRERRGGLASKGLWAKSKQKGLL